MHYDLHLEVTLCDLAAHAFKPVVYRPALRYKPVEIFQAENPKV